MTPIEKRNQVLDAMEKLFTPRGSWIQGAEAADRNKLETDLPPTHPRAECWCITGAIHRDASNLGMGPIDTHDIFDFVAKACALAANKDDYLEYGLDDPWHFLVEWNDSNNREREDILAAIRAARDLPL